MGRAPPPAPSPRERPATDLHALPQLGPRRREASAPAGSPACPPLSSWKRPLPCPCPLPLALGPQETGLEKGLDLLDISQLSWCRARPGSHMSPAHSPPYLTPASIRHQPPKVDKHLSRPNSRAIVQRFQDLSFGIRPSRFPDILHTLLLSLASQSIASSLGGCEKGGQRK